MLKNTILSEQTNGERANVDEVKIREDLGFWDKVQVEADRNRFLSTDQAFMNYVEREAVKRNPEFTDMGAPLDNKMTDILALGTTGKLDVDSIASTDYSKEELDKGITVNGVTIDADTVKKLKTLKTKDDSIFKNFYKDIKIGATDIYNKASIAGERSGVIENLAYNIPAYLKGVGARGVIDNLSISDVQRAVDLGDMQGINDILGQNETIRGNRFLIPNDLLSTVEVASIAAGGLGAKTVVGKVAVEAGLGMAGEAALQFGKGGAVDVAGAQLGEKYRAMQQVEGVGNVLMAGAMVPIMHSVPRVIGKMTNIKAEKFRVKQEGIRQDYASLSLLNDNLVKEDVNHAVVNDTVIRNNIDKDVEFNSTSDLSGVNNEKLKFNLGNKEPGKTGYASFERDINTKDIKTNTTSKIDGYEDQGYSQVLLWKDKEGKYEAINGNKVVNSTEKVNAFVLKEEDGFTRIDFERISDLNRALNDADVSRMKKVLQTNDTKRTQAFIDGHKKLTEMKRNISNATDELVSLLHSGDIGPATFFRAAGEKSDNQLKMAQALEDGVEFSDNIVLRPEFENEKFNAKAISNMKGLVSELNKNKEFRDGLLSDMENVFHILENSKNAGRSARKKDILDYYTKTLYNNNKDFKKTVLEGIKNGKQNEEIANDIFKGEWRASSDFSKFNGKRDTNRSVQKASEFAKRTESLANDSKFKSDLDKQMERFINTIKTEEGVEPKKSVFIDGNEFELDAVVDNAVDIYGNSYSKEMTVREIIEAQKAEEKMFDILTVCGR